MDLIKWEKAKFEKTGLIIAEDTTIQEWQELGQSLKKIEGAVQFWIGDWARFGDKKGFYTDSKVYDKLEEITGLSHGTLKDYKSVCENVQSSNRFDDLSFTHHIEVAKLEPQKQEFFLNKAVEENLSVRELRREIHKEKYNSELIDSELPTGKYRIIYADPPWSYGNDRTFYGGDQISHYPSMTIEDLCKMPIVNIAEDNSVLFLWVTSPILQESFEVINAWGFKYKSSFVWDKIKHNMGHYNSVRHELLLICTKGSCLPDNSKLIDSVISIERTEHSEKPEEFRNIIDTLYTYGNRIELFARKKTEGWEVFGNEI